MSDYSNTFNGAGKDAAQSTIFGSDFDTQFDAIASMSATKADKVLSPTAGNVIELDTTGNLVDSGIASSTIWTSINDGTGSGLDADLLDGRQGTAFTYSDILASGTDLNTVTQSGIYKLNTGHLNAPTGVDYGQLLVMHGGGDTITQIVTDYISGNFYWRSGNPPDVGGTGAWGDWTKPSTSKNAIINGNFDIWQRGTSQTSSGYGSDDRWSNIHNGSTKTHSQQTFTLGQTDVPGNPKYFSKTVVSSVAGASNFVAKEQKIEGVRTFAGETVTLSFWAKADAAKNIAIEFLQNFGTGGTPSATITGIGSQKFALTTTWQKFTATVSIPSISGKTLGTNGDDCLQLRFWFDAGSNYDARSDSLGQQSGTFDIAQVQLEKGSVATDFERRTIAEELALCQRYYEKSGVLSASGYSNATGNIYVCIAQWCFAVTKRTVPTITRLVNATVNLVNQPYGAEIDQYSTMLRADSTGSGRTYWADAEFSADAEL